MSCNFEWYKEIEILVKCSLTSKPYFLKNFEFSQNRFVFLLVSFLFLKTVVFYEHKEQFLFRLTILTTILTPDKEQFNLFTLFICFRVVV